MGTTDGPTVDVVGVRHEAVIPSPGDHHMTTRPDLIACEDGADAGRRVATVAEVRTPARLHGYGAADHRRVTRDAVVIEDVARLAISVRVRETAADPRVCARQVKRV